MQFTVHDTKDIFCDNGSICDTKLIISLEYINTLIKTKLLRKKKKEEIKIFKKNLSSPS